LQDIDRQSLKEKRETAILLCPWHGHCLDAMRGALHPRCLGNQDRLELARIEMSPTTLLRMVMAGQLRLAIRSSKTDTSRMLHVDADLLPTVIQFNADHVPRPCETQKVLVQFFVLHGDSP
jgi:hypothetical protein